jgi:hypothetical protein
MTTSTQTPTKDQLDLWQRVLWAQAKKNKSYRQARAIYRRLAGHWPGWKWPGMPREARDLPRVVGRVPQGSCY